ncbi:hypothetical protein [Paenibacillus woosongensis]|uniref:Nucleoside-diphosphate sugar epimerase n=1 Tax=Paenibacillus woosongensis TaxID=307580 RepID=A0ABQ4MXD9_9BACL|nr:hypothetical protein [Paenibacillus woosongensis]GIP60583.1 hypothetical protein J15TS10_43970 [Paenibacillus woosongensis]
MKKQIQDIAFDLDNTVTVIEGCVDTLADIEVEFGHLREGMDNAFDKGDEMHYYREHHRQVRVLSTLMIHVMEELKHSSGKAAELTQTLFKTVRKESEAASA